MTVPRATRSAACPGSRSGGVGISSESSRCPNLSSRSGRSCPRRSGGGRTRFDRGRSRASPNSRTSRRRRVPAAPTTVGDAVPDRRAGAVAEVRATLPPTEGAVARTSLHEDTVGPRPRVPTGAVRALGCKETAVLAPPVSVFTRDRDRGSPRPPRLSPRARARRAQGCARLFQRP
jgi:hypothetical protein